MKIIMQCKALLHAIYEFTGKCLLTELTKHKNSSTCSINFCREEIFVKIKQV
jgi:hypothetical protein